MTGGAKTWVTLLLPIVLLSAISVVYVKYQGRSLFTQLQKEIHFQDALEVEWSRLQLEQNTWSSNNRIEKLARQKLGLQAPLSEQVIYIKTK